MLFRSVADVPSAWPPSRVESEVARRLAYARERDPVGDAAHVGLAMVYLVLLPIATAPQTIAYFVLLAYAILRSHVTWRSYASLLPGWLGWAIVAWGLLRLTSLAWSSNPAVGWDQTEVFRLILLPLALWPIIDRAPLLVAAFLAGVLVVNVVQAFQVAGVLGLSVDHNDRAGGLIHAIHTGQMCGAAVVWHAAGILGYRAWRRWLSGAALLVAAAGLLLSGSRGPWIATAIAGGGLLVVAAWRRPAVRPVAVAALGLAVATMVGAVLLGGDVVRTRFREALADIDAARQGELDSNLGLRFAMWETARQVILDRPLTGVGAGGFDLDLVEETTESTYTFVDGLFHAHSLYLHEPAVIGVAGGALVLVIVGIAGRRAIRSRVDSVWAVGTPFVMLAWFVGTAFDAFHLNGNMFGLFLFLVALTLPARPRPIVGRWEPDAA